MNLHPKKPRHSARPAALTVVALAAAGSAPAAVAPQPVHAAMPAQAHTLQARIAAVRQALADAAPPTADSNSAEPTAAPVPNWTNWPKWSKWSNWANK